MSDEALIAGRAPIIHNWFASALLKDRTDAFRRSQEVWADRSSPAPAEFDEMYTPAQRGIDLAIAKQCFAGLAAVREDAPGFFEAFDYEWAFDLGSYLTTIPGGTRVESQSLRAQVFLLQALTTAWEIHDPETNPLSFENICARRVTDLDPVPRCVRDCGFRYVIVSDEFRMQLLRLLGGLRAFSGSSADENPSSAMERLCSRQATEAFANLPLTLLPRQIAREFRVAKKPWDLALLCMAEQKVEVAIPHFSQLPLDVFPPKAGSIEVHLLDVLTPFFLYHEAAHLLLNHAPSRSVEKEMEADSLAFALFFASRGWRDPIDSALGFGEVASTLLGPLFFLWVVNCFTRLELLTAREGGKAALQPFLEELAQRRANLATRAQATVELAKKQVPDILPTESFQRLEGLSWNLSSAAASFEQNEALGDIVALSTRALEAWSATL